MKNNNKNITSLRSFKMKEIRKSEYRSEGSFSYNASTSYGYGIVLHNNRNKNFGSIMEDTGQTIFFFESTSVTPGDRVSFEITRIEWHSGIGAKNIRKM